MTCESAISAVVVAAAVTAARTETAVAVDDDDSDDVDEFWSNSSAEMNKVSTDYLYDTAVLVVFVVVAEAQPDDT